MLIKYNIEIAVTVFVSKTKPLCLVEDKERISLPTTWLEKDKTLLKCAENLISKLTDVDPLWLRTKFINVFDAPQRYPTRTITNLFACQLPEVTAAPPFLAYKWMSLDEIFARKNEVFADHLSLIQQGLWRL